MTDSLQYAGSDNLVTNYHAIINFIIIRIIYQKESYQSQKC